MRWNITTIAATIFIVTMATISQLLGDRMYNSSAVAEMGDRGHYT